MTLSDRLAAAARARGERIADDVAPSGDVVVAERLPRVEMILAPSKKVTAVLPELGAAPDAVCPTCGRTGELGIVDLARRTVDWACDTCGSMWRINMPAPARSDLH